MLAKLFAISLADLFLVGEIGITIGDEPCKPHEIFGLATSSFEGGKNIRDSLAGLLCKVVRNQALGDWVPTDLPCNGNDPALSDGGIGVSAWQRPLFRIHQFWQFAH